MPLSFDPGAASNAPVPPLQPVAGVAVQPRPGGTTSSEQGSDDRVGDIVTGGTFDGLSLSYSTVTRTVSGTNTDKGSVAVAVHEGLADPHGMYFNEARGDARYLQLIGGSLSGALAVPSLQVGDSGLSYAFTLTAPDDNAFALFHRYSADTGAPGLVLIKTRGGTPTDFTTPTPAGDNLGVVYFQGSDGTANRLSATLTAQAVSAWSPSNRETQLLFSAAAAGGTVPQTALSLTGDYVRVHKELRAAATSPGVAGEVLTSQGPGLPPIWAVGGGGGGSSDHGSLIGLADDDHPQYHNDARGDARYLQLTGGTLTGQTNVSADADRRVSLTGAANSPGVTTERNSDTQAHAPLFSLARTRGSLATKAALQDGDPIGRFLWFGHNGTDYVESARIVAEASEAWSVGSHGTSLHFFSTPTGSPAAVESLSIVDSVTAHIPLSVSAELRAGSDPGTSGQVLTSQGAGSPPVWNTPGDGWTYVVMSSDEVWTDPATYTPLNSLAFLAPEAGTYLIEWVVTYQTNNLSSLPRFTLYRPTTTVDMSVRLMSTPSTGTPSFIWHSMTSSTVYTPLGTAPSLESLLLTGQGLVTTTGAMTGSGIRIGGGPENIAGATVTIKAGSLLKYRKIA